MAHRILKRPRTVAGMSQLPPTRTSRVPNALIYTISMRLRNTGRQQESRTITSFVKAVARVAMRGEDDNFMPERLETYSSIDDQTLSTTNAQIRVKEHDRLRRCRHFSTGDEMFHLWTSFTCNTTTGRPLVRFSETRALALFLALFQLPALALVGEPWLHARSPRSLAGCFRIEVKYVFKYR